MKTFVNSLSIFRILAAFAIVPMLMYQMYWLAFIVFTLAAISDFFDGWLAKKYKVVSKVGAVLDHIADKFLVVNMLVMISVMLHAWFVFVPALLMIGREIYVSGLREALGDQKVGLPVPNPRFSLVKIKNTLQVIAIGAFLFMFALGSSLTPGMTSRIIMFIIYILPFIAIYGLWIAMGTSLWSAVNYTLDFKKKIKK
ncbi:MAG: CDP-alcohol phosphatidyltransferase family protein [Alphaproteobacteria bacterium]|nr:CDP-alcohol phosphatidyltransferase family protein [Alphaproteobacteria bacterium]